MVCQGLSWQLEWEAPYSYFVFVKLALSLFTMVLAVGADFARSVAVAVVGMSAIAWIWRVNTVLPVICYKIRSVYRWWYRDWISYVMIWYSLHYKNESNDGIFPNAVKWGRVYRCGYQDKISYIISYSLHGETGWINAFGNLLSNIFEICNICRHV